MESEVKLSICISTYNRARYLGQTLDSIVPQLSSQVELVVLDGCSPDDTESVMRKYLSEFSSVRYIREDENSGVDKDYDKAIEAARGEYCWLMTDDDLLVSGAVSEVLNELEEDVDHILVNAKVKSRDLKSTIVSSRLPSVTQQNYGETDQHVFFLHAANCLSFIGSVVIKRKEWLSREREKFYGSLFIHVGVIFQCPLLKKTKIIQRPLITIRYGNAMWTARGFEIWMFMWPELIWSFDVFPDREKQQIVTRYPWKKFGNILLYRALGGYTAKEYKKYLSNKKLGFKRIFYLLLLIVPGRLLNSLLSVFCLLCRPESKGTLYDLSLSENSTFISRKISSLKGL